MRILHFLQGFKKEFKKNWQLFLLATPGVILVFLFAYLPMFGIVIAFKSYNYEQGLLGSPWCGFKNFQFLFASNTAWEITKLTLGYNFLFILLGLVLPVILALAFNEVRRPLASKIYQTISIMPNFLSWVIMSYIGLALLDTNGFFNSVLQMFGKDPVYFYADPKYWPAILILTSQWKSIGYSSVVYLACICGISVEYYEAAILDGASKWQQIWYITLPSLKPMMVITTIMALGHIFNSDFGLFYQMPMNQGQLYPATETIDVYVYNALQSMGNINMSAAASVFQSAVGFVTILLANAAIRKIDNENALF